MAIPIKSIAENSIDVIYETFGEIQEIVTAYPGIRQNLKSSYNAETGEVVRTHSPDSLSLKLPVLIINTDVMLRQNSEIFDERDLLMIVRVSDIEAARDESITPDLMRIDVDWKIDREGGTTFFIRSLKLDPTNTFYEGIIRSLE